MADAHVIVRDDQASHKLDIARREWGLPSGPFCQEGQRFIDALRV